MVKKYREVLKQLAYQRAYVKRDLDAILAPYTVSK